MKLDDVIRFKTWYIPLGPDECWLWIGNKDDDGYGNFKLGGKQTFAHRIAYLVHKGDFDPSLLVCHTCDNPPCVNPNHLFLGTSLDNVRDMQAKGKHAGRPTPACKDEIIKLLRISAANSNMIATWFGVSREFVEKCRKELAQELRTEDHGQRTTDRG